MLQVRSIWSTCTVVSNEQHRIFYCSMNRSFLEAMLSIYVMSFVAIIYIQTNNALPCCRAQMPPPTPCLLPQSDHLHPQQKTG